MRKLTTAILCGCICLSGCSTSVKKEGNGTGEQVTDNRMSDESFIKKDADLYIGDLGVEQLVFPERIRSLVQETEQTTLLDPYGYPLIKKFPNKNIVPIKGKYVENVITTALRYLKTPYVYGSDRTDPSTFDCSDFTRWVYLYAIGMDLPWNSRSQAAYADAFSTRKYHVLRKAKRGDLLFFTWFRGNRASDYKKLKASEKPITHMGIYLGKNKIIHCASKETGGVRIDMIKGKHLEYRLLFGAGILD